MSFTDIVLNDDCTGTTLASWSLIEYGAFQCQKQTAF